MDRQLRKLLPSAIGESQFVIAVNVDIRGFSEFSQRVESVEAAVFLRRAYVRMAEDYFPNASFFKLTGDGMLLVFTYADDDRLKAIAAEVFTSSFRLIDEFPTLTASDPMVNFRVPDRVGIGISRGAASRIFSGRTTLDYSGRVLNLASRLMNIARPTGIVFDAAFDPALVPTKDASQFAPADVYLHGIAEDVPMPVLHTHEMTVIPPSSTQPLRKTDWAEHELPETYGDILKITGRLVRHELPFEPRDPSQISLRVWYPNRRGTRNIAFDFEGFKYVTDGSRHFVEIDQRMLRARLEAPPMPRRADVVTTRIRFPRKSDS